MRLNVEFKLYSCICPNKNIGNNKNFIFFDKLNHITTKTENSISQVSLTLGEAFVTTQFDATQVNYDFYASKDGKCGCCMLQYQT